MTDQLDLDAIDAALATDPEYFNLVFPDGPPTRPMTISKHSAFNHITMRHMIAKAERLSPDLADMLMWAVWWQCLDSNRAKFLSDHHFEVEAENRALTAEVRKLREAQRQIELMEEALVNAWATIHQKVDGMKVEQSFIHARTRMDIARREIQALKGTQP